MYSVIPWANSRFLTTVYSELENSGPFERMDITVDEDEHSIEMHLPYIAKVMEQ